MGGSKTCFNFTVRITGRAYGYVFAESKEQAEKLINADEWDDISDVEWEVTGRPLKLVEEDES